MPVEAFLHEMSTATVVHGQAGRCSGLPDSNSLVTEEWSENLPDRCTLSGGPLLQEGEPLPCDTFRASVLPGSRFPCGEKSAWVLPARREHLRRCSSSFAWGGCERPSGPYGEGAKALPLPCCAFPPVCAPSGALLRQGYVSSVPYLARRGREEQGRSVVCSFL